MVRAVNMGISCIIDGFGRIIALPPGSTTWHEAKNREAVIVGTVPLYSQNTLYVRWGDALPLICWAMMVAGLAISFFKRKQQQ
jgi:apolipoprotein N-acyltransferase